MKYSPEMQQVSPTTFISGDEDPWFKFEGPFIRGTYRMEFRAHVGAEVPPTNMKLTDTNMKMSRDLQFHKNWLNWYNEITKQMKLAFSGEKTVAEAAKLANTEGDRIIRSS